MSLIQQRSIDPGYGDRFSNNSLTRTALLSPCGNFRYELTRTWDDSLHRMIFVMLNPSTADGLKDDHTIRKCVQFAKMDQCGGIVVVNLYAYRATSPIHLKAAGWPQGPENWRIVRDCLTAAHLARDYIVCAWGRNAANRQESHELIGWAEYEGIKLWALKRSPDGTPHHPLMLPYSSELEPMT